RNEVGRAIRRYFIRKEKEARGVGLLPAERGLFTGMRRKIINGRNMYPFRQFLREKAGYSPRSSGYHYRVGYANHFVTVDNVALISEELALQIYHSRRLTANRASLREMQPVLPFTNHQIKEV